MMSPDKILIATTSFAEEDKRPLLLLEKAGFSIVTNPYGHRMTGDELATLSKDVIAVIAGTEKWDECAIRNAPRLKVLSRCGAGMDNVDLRAAQRADIKVFNTPDAPTESVAELTLALMLATLRRIGEMNTQLHQKQWARKMGGLLNGKTVGLIGLGRIGRRVAELLKPFDVRLLAAESKPDTAFAKRQKIALVSLSALLKNADIVSLHLTLNDHTRRL
ncbi:MAG TPA: NAD(P)-dependent oxidoreductase, partial [Elusimicrobiota bacterium]|nr:NAD(P)-dependent oxidoreductase [Elusimicrobiota bacterium]